MSVFASANPHLSPHHTHISNDQLDQPHIASPKARHPSPLSLGVRALVMRDTRGLVFSQEYELGDEAEEEAIRAGEVGAAAVVGKSFTAKRVSLQTFYDDCVADNLRRYANQRVRCPHRQRSECWQEADGRDGPSP